MTSASSSILLACLLAANVGSYAATPPPGLDAADLEALRGDAAARAGVTADRVEVQLAEALTWPDGGLGCPRAGVVYTQALVHGHRVVLRANDRSWPYHLAHGRWVLCGGTGPLAGGALPGHRPGERQASAPAM